MIKALIFDLDQTLIDREKTMKKFLNEQIDRYQLNVKSARANLIEAIFRHQKNGYADKLTAYNAACKELNEEVSLAGLLFEDMQQNYGKNPTLFSGTREALELLKADFHLGLITNGRSRVQMAKIESSGLSELFDSVQISQQVGIKKPAPEIFQRCLDALVVLPSEAVFIGDHPVNDIEAAAAVGMHTVWFENRHYSRPARCHYSIKTLTELRPTLFQIIDDS